MFFVFGISPFLRFRVLAGSRRVGDSAFLSRSDRATFCRINAKRSETCLQVSDLCWKSDVQSYPCGSILAFRLITCSQDVFTDGRFGGRR